MAVADPRDARIAELMAINEAQAARIEQPEALVREPMARPDGTARSHASRPSFVRTHH